VCGIKNFVSVRLYSAPQSQTIVAILGICAYGEPDQAGIECHIQKSPLPVYETIHETFAQTITRFLAHVLPYLACVFSRHTP